MLRLLLALLPPGSGFSGPVAQTACLTEELRALSTPVEVIFDETALKAVRDAWDPSWGRTVATVSTDDETGEVEGRVWATGVDDAATEALAAALAAGVREPEGPDESVRLFISTGAQLDLVLVEEFRTCPPTITNRDDIQRELARLVRTFTDRRPGDARVRLWVDENGVPSDVRIDRSSMVPELDLAALDVVRRARFTPAMMEGIPVAVWVAFPVTVGRAGDPTPAGPASRGGAAL